MLSREQPDRIQVAFDDHRLVANAGLILGHFARARSIPAYSGSRNDPCANQREYQ